MNLSFLLLMQMASNMGTLCGNLVGALMRTILTDEQLYSWGWRIPFLSGIMIAFVGIYLRLYGEESNHIHAGEDEKEDTHWRDVFRKENLPALGAATFTPMVSCVCLQIVPYSNVYLIIMLLRPTQALGCRILYNICLDGHLHGSAG